MQTISVQQVAKAQPGYFGGCPHCGSDNGYFNIKRDHWFFCEVHHAMWCIGSNLFSSWRDEDETVWAENRAKFESFEIVEPVRAEVSANEEVSEPLSDHWESPDDSHYF